MIKLYLLYVRKYIIFIYFNIIIYYKTIYTHKHILVHEGENYHTAYPYPSLYQNWQLSLWTSTHFQSYLAFQLTNNNNNNK